MYSIELSLSISSTASSTSEELAEDDASFEASLSLFLRFIACLLLKLIILDCILRLDGLSTCLNIVGTKFGARGLLLFEPETKCSLHIHEYSVGSQPVFTAHSRYPLTLAFRITWKTVELEPASFFVLVMTTYCTTAFYHNSLTATQSTRNGDAYCARAKPRTSIVIVITRGELEFKTKYPVGYRQGN